MLLALKLIFIILALLLSLGILIFILKFSIIKQSLREAEKELKKIQKEKLENHNEYYIELAKLFITFAISNLLKNWTSKNLKK